MPARLAVAGSKVVERVAVRVACSAARFWARWRRAGGRALGVVAGLVS